MYPKEEKIDVMEVCGGIDEGENCKSTGFDAAGTTMMTSTDDQRGIWEIDVRAQQQNLLHEMNDPSMFYNDQFPQIPDFPCMSSSSSSSSNPAPAKPISSATTTSSASSASSSTSSAASWAVLKSEYVTEEEGEELRINRKKRSHREVEPAPVTAAAEAAVVVPDGSGTIDCMDVMENFGYMDLIDGNELWDPSVIFEQNPPDLQECVAATAAARGYSNGSEVVQESEMKDDGGARLDELGVMFFDWLKSNKEFISAEDMRKIKLKKSTVECASKRLGSSKEGKKQLLKLILEWVQQHQLQRKNAAAAAGELPTTQYLPPPPLPPQPPPPQPQPFNSWVPPTEMNHGLWIPPPVAYPSYMADQGSAFSYMGDGSDIQYSGLNRVNPYNNNNSNNNNNNPGSGEFQVLESAPSWNPSQITIAASPYNNNNQFPDHHHHHMGNNNNYGAQMMPLAAPGYAYTAPQVNYAAVGEQRLMRLGSSATKEARKKRMARQRKTYFHHHHHSRQNHQNHLANSDHHPHPHAMLVDENCSGKSHGGNWLYWPSPASANAVLPPPPPPPPPHMESPHRPPSRPQQAGDRQSKQSPPDKRQGLKTEKNLKFLLQKVLKQSDVGSLGRIVLPKKEAESHLPDLDSRDGISIAMEDIGTSQVWNMRYRFWPNNKSRMYLLENTGDFVKANGLQEGDFIVLYSDVKCGKYLIRGVKVRQPASGKSESKKPSVKRSYRSTSQSTRSTPSSPAKITAI